MSIQNCIDTVQFDPLIFRKELLKASGSEDSTIPRQIDYLADYCHKLGAKTIVREGHYIDRHFVDDFAQYYSRMLNPPQNSVKRFHVFSKPFSDDEFSGMLQSAIASPQKTKEIQEELSKDYLGFISIRPIPSAPVGRTVLRKIADAGEQRQILATNHHDVHLANLKFGIDGLAFQQQDVAVGACATTALWTALSRVARVEGMRAPTPVEITEAATRHLLLQGRSFPAGEGLIMAQLSEAIRCCGFAPEAVRADMRPEVFAVVLHTYLLSGIPVVLALRKEGTGHAVVVVGFTIDETPHPILEASVPVRSACLKKIYVHDDRLGPYARGFLEPFAHPELGEGLLFKIEDETWLVESALAPVYPKLRLPVRSLIVLAELTNDIVEKIIGSAAAPELSVEFYYERSGEYLSRLAGRIPDVPSANFLRCVSLSRWCAIIRWHLGKQVLAEFVYDTTDIVRGNPRPRVDLLRAIINMIPRFSSDFHTLGSSLGAPVLG
jgi:hypothetical protein